MHVDMALLVADVQSLQILLRDLAAAYRGESPVSYTHLDVYKRQLQSFCSLEEKSVQEKQERQVAEKQDSRVEASRAASVTKGDNDEAVKKVVASMQTEKNEATTKAKKPSIHERLEINKRKIQEKQDVYKRQVHTRSLTVSMIATIS